MTAHKNKLAEIREECEGRLYTFAKTMFPRYSYGEVHKDLYDYFQFGEERNKAALIPRDHLKSHCIATYCAWRITVDPWWTILYVSASDSLAKVQMGVIQNILLSEQHRLLWPEMLNFQKNQYGELVHKPIGNNVWTQDKIMVDHPARKERSVRDATLAIKSVGSGKTGLHANEIVFDDLVTDENYKSEVKRNEVIDCYTNMVKIATTSSLMKAVGTRYADNDLYGLLKESTYPVYEDGIITRHVPLWTWFEKVVEDSPYRDGTGTYLWPKQWNEEDGRYYGFDQQELAIKKANQTMSGDSRQLELWFGQYYNDPNDSSLDKLSKDDFLYYEPRKLEQENGTWYFNKNPLKLFAAADLAFTESTAASAKRRDYTAIAVIGIDPDGYIYILSLDRFQTGKLNVYYERIIDLYEYWGFREITVETNNGGKLVKSYLEDEIRRQGGSLVIKGMAHVSHQGKKEERIDQTLMPRYENKTIYHKKDGITKMLEEELVVARPPHDDLKDVLALVVSESKPPMASYASRYRKKSNKVVNISRFGGGRRR